MHLHLDKLKQVVSGLPEVERVIVMGYVKPESELDLSGLQVTFKYITVQWNLLIPTFVRTRKVCRISRLSD